MLCQLASLSKCSGFDAEDTGQQFVRWYEHGYQAAGGLVFDIGGTTRNAISRLQQGMPALQAGGTNESDNGNGSLMRIVPIGLWFHDADDATVVARSHESSKITHGHVRSQVCCAVYDLTVSELLAGTSPGDALPTAVGRLTKTYSQLQVSQRDAFEREWKTVQNHSPRTGSGYVVDCWWSAWECIVSTGDYEACVQRAVRFGNDTDTTAAVAGGLAGAIYGYDGLPNHWLAELRLEPQQHQLIEQFTSAILSRR
jgi:ADP-ribosylglycohydrolase